MASANVMLCRCRQAVHEQRPHLGNPNRPSRQVLERGADLGGREDAVQVPAPQDRADLEVEGLRDPGDGVSWQQLPKRTPPGRVRDEFDAG